MSVSNSDRTSPRALIIGGSVGGLFTATVLRAIGWQVDIFERSPHERLCCTNPGRSGSRLG